MDSRLFVFLENDRLQMSCSFLVARFRTQCRACHATDGSQRHGKDFAQALAAYSDISTTERHIRGAGEIVISSRQLEECFYQKIQVLFDAGKIKKAL